MGSVRHFFSTQDELLRFAVVELGEHLRRRIEAATPACIAAVEQGRPLDAAVALLKEVLPLDPRRMTEAQVWAAFTAPPITDPEMTRIRRLADDGIRQLCRGVLAMLNQADALHPRRDLDVETDRMHALVDGLTVHMLLDPIGFPPGRVKTVLITHINDLRPERIGAHFEPGGCE